MAKQPIRRYQTASQFGDDLIAWKNGDPVTARPETRLQKAARWYARNRTFAAMSLVILGLMLATTIGSLVSAKRIADESRKTERASQQALQAAALASRQREVALQSLNNLVFDIQRKLKDRPGTLQVRNSILESALEGLQEIVADEGSTPIDHSSIVAHLRMGEIEMAKGDDERAAEHFNQSRQMAEAYLIREPGDPAALADLTAALIALGDMGFAKFDYQTALEFYRSAAATRQEMAEANPSPGNEVEYCRALVRVGTARSGLGDDAEASSELLEAVDRMDEMLDEKREDTDFLRTLVITLSAAANHLIKIGNFEDAMPLVQRVRDLNEQLLDADEYNVDYLLDAAVSFSQLAQVHVQRLEWDQAHEFARESRKLHQRIVDANPDNVWSRSNLGLQWHIEAMTLLALGDLEGAESAGQENLSIHRQILKAEPTNSRFAAPTAECLTLLAGVAIRQGDLAKGKRRLEESLEVLGKVPGEQIAANAILQQAVEDNTNVSQALASALSREDLPIHSSIADCSDIEKLALAFAAYKVVFQQQRDQALQLANLLSREEIEDQAIDTQFRFCLLATYAKLLSITENSGNPEDIERRRQIGERACENLERYLASRENLLFNVLADPDLKDLPKHS